MQTITIRDVPCKTTTKFVEPDRGQTDAGY